MAIAALQSDQHRHSVHSAVHNGKSAVSSSSIEGLAGFKDALSSKEIMSQQAFSMNQSPVVTEEQALKAAQDMMEAFYTQSFKTLFEEIKNEDEEGDTFSLNMTKDIFVEQLAKTLARSSVSPTHRRIADMILSQSKNAETTAQDNNASPEVDLVSAFDSVSREGGVNVIA